MFVSSSSELMQQPFSFLFFIYIFFIHRVFHFVFFIPCCVFFFLLSDSACRTCKSQRVLVALSMIAILGMQQCPIINVVICSSTCCITLTSRWRQWGIEVIRQGKEVKKDMYSNIFFCTCKPGLGMEITQKKL